ncbi:hypothetical protein ABEF92_003093 [Exophiala dermatitidis]|uniref:Uncharacterized protein n=1 Tax=Exophiala dermatitidis (strain ATCC 34100 / CBS 525.76 / NIH/UT8656) TaxID=858893 RepID=H6BYD0_EXODN|nr:uncharacterized protein HMPREF1120_04770 [Exophiala dermatitidis NIH/UT8656]XP_009157160.1 hypothetical protein, variant 2 [Exophiala dermatitidis NIH/UT8656]XP_009157161.1 hypothetical protein, variant 1 [Exophiala dermatitidis NIH/UT8656]EHY56698.1 hypothetical protein, variant 2 [Exophiala dermatitidis NIH/UT8656]EHY56699.1 hypothetical protein, variant 1 [Exophiala dermatitidis NIH/UT8656]EHY56700.1 hypothetical protein HMPREF1120_04770 [Exophiala dermatitidis NIH/UT8656]
MRPVELAIMGESTMQCPCMCSTSLPARWTTSSTKSMSVALLSGPPRRHRMPSRPLRTGERILPEVQSTFVEWQGVRTSGPDSSDNMDTVSDVHRKDTTAYYFPGTGTA